MESKRITFKTLAIAGITILTSSNAFAHSNHDHSTVPFNWEFSKN